MRQIAEIAAKFLPGCRIEISGEAGNDPRSYRADFTRVLPELPGFDPKWALERGAVELHGWMPRHEADPGRLLGEDFIWLKRIQALRNANRIDADFRWTMGR